jgi:hypothetical protein
LELNRAYPEYAANGGEVLVIGPTRVDRARLYYERFGLQYPYLCDPEWKSFTAYGLGAETGWASVMRAARMASVIAGDLVSGRFAEFVPPEAALLQARQSAFFVVDKQGMIRVANPKVGIHSIPGREELLKILKTYA